MSDSHNEPQAISLASVAQETGAVAKLRLHVYPPRWVNHPQQKTQVYSRISYTKIKRVVDLAVVVLALPAALLIIAVAAAAIAMTMGRPILFFQDRVGVNGWVFRLAKLRTMRNGDQFNDGATMPHDPRITPLGNLLRRSHIDELPQLWNVFLGEMTLIGPRAEQPHLVEKYRAEIPNYDFRHSVTPGLSGLAQVSYGYAADTAETFHKTEYDLYYVNNFSPRLDLHIVARTIQIFMDPRFVR